MAPKGFFGIFDAFRGIRRDGRGQCCGTLAPEYPFDRLTLETSTRQRIRSVRCSAVLIGGLLALSAVALPRGRGGVGTPDVCNVLSTLEDV